MVAVVPIEAIAEALVVRQVARRLLEIAHNAAPLKNFSQNVRGLFASEVHPTELSHRVVTVFEEDFLVEVVSSLKADGGID